MRSDSQRTRMSRLNRPSGMLQNQRLLPGRDGRSPRQPLRQVKTTGYPRRGSWRELLVSCRLVLRPEFTALHTARWTMLARPHQGCAGLSSAIPTTMKACQETTGTGHEPHLDHASVETNSKANPDCCLRHPAAVATRPACPGRKTGYCLFRARARRSAAGGVEEPAGRARQADDAIHTCSRRQHNGPSGRREPFRFRPDA